jgi:hypothetical protein
MVLTFGLGDWCSVSSVPTPTGLTATAVFYMDALDLKQAAALLGKTEDVTKCVVFKGLVMVVMMMAALLLIIVRVITWH